MKFPTPYVDASGKDPIYCYGPIRVTLPGSPLTISVADAEQRAEEIVSSRDSGDYDTHAESEINTYDWPPKNAS
jgi:hypothetical protein